MEFRIFESIEELNGTVTLEELAAAENYDNRILEKLLNFFVCCGLLKKSRSEKEQRGMSYLLYFDDNCIQNHEIKLNIKFQQIV